MNLLEVFNIYSEKGLLNILSWTNYFATTVLFVGSAKPPLRICASSYSSYCTVWEIS
jgi:hypothetical protein